MKPKIALISALATSLLLILAALSHADLPLRKNQTVASVTSTKTTVTMTDGRTGGSGAAFNASEVIICNTGTKVIYASESASAVSTTGDIPIQPSMCHTIIYQSADVSTGGGIAAVSIATAGSDTSSATVSAKRSQ